jgi:hypothetical protein
VDDNAKRAQAEQMRAGVKVHDQVANLTTVVTLHHLFILQCQYNPWVRLETQLIMNYSL